MAKSALTDQKLLIGVIIALGVILALWKLSVTKEVTHTDVSSQKPEVNVSPADIYLKALKSRSKPIVEMETETATIEIRKKLETTIKEFNQLYGDAGSLDFDAAKELVKQRKTRSQELAKKLADLGTEGVPSILAAYQTATDAKTKLWLIDSLKINQDAESVMGLETIINQETIFSYREAAANAIASHNNDQSEYALANLLNNEEDHRLRVVAVQALTKFKNSLPLLVDKANDDPSELVRLESIRSIGIIGNSEARLNLEDIATSNPAFKVRQNAIMELGRSFGQEAATTLNILAEDDDPEIRKVARRAQRLIN